MSLLEKNSTDLLEELQTGNVSSEQIVAESLKRIDKHDPNIRAFISIDSERSLLRAKSIDERRSRGESLGKLAGLPIAVKDVICTKGTKTTCGSKMLKDFVSPYDATVIRKLEAADAIIIGKTNMDEFAMGSSTENSAFFPTSNPWDIERIPGGSSGGSAASVASGMVPFSIGTDTGGSIRQPAALCGVVGLKPTYGRVSRFGQVAFASSLDQIGPMTRCVEDAALLLEVIAGADPNDSTCSPRPVEPFSEKIKQDNSNLKIGVAEQFFVDGLDDQIKSAVESAIKVFESMGAKIEKISLPTAPLGIPTYYILAPCEASSNLARYDGVHYGYRYEGELSGSDRLADQYCKTRSLGFGAEVKRRIMLGTYALSAGYYDAYYLKASKIRRLIREDFEKSFEQVDIILGPTTPTPAFRLGEKTKDPLEMYLADIYTVSANLAGVPAMSIPCGFSTEDLPIGLQLHAAPFQETKLLQAAKMFQSQTDWHHRRPTLQ